MKPAWQQMLVGITLGGLIPFNGPVYLDKARKVYKEFHGLTWKEMPSGITAEM